MSEIKNIFAVNDNDESLKGKSGGVKFGLNHGNITKLEFLDNAGKDNGPANAVDIWVQVGDSEKRMRLYDDTGNSLFNKKNIKVAPGEEGYDDLFFDSMVQKIAVIKHALKAVGVTDEQIVKATSGLDATKIAEGLKILADLAPSGFQTKSVDIFFEYQWEIGEDQDKTYPVLPKNMKGGRFLCPTIAPVGGKWTEERAWKDAEGNDVTGGLRYVDGTGNVHQFDRTADFMGSNKGTQQGVGATAAANNMAASAESATKSTW